MSFSNSRLLDPKTNKPLARADMDKLRDAQRERRGYYNPVRWLTLEGLETLIEQGQRGNYPKLQFLFAEIERRFEVLSVVIERRLAAIRKLTWNIKETDDSFQAKLQAEELKLFFNRIANLEDAIGHLAMANFRGFSHLGVVTNATGEPVKLDPVPQWHFKRGGIYGPWRFCASEGDAGALLDPTGWIVRECRCAIDESASRRFIQASLAEADYASAVEDAGILALFLELPQVTDEKQRAALEASAEIALAGMRATVPNGTKLHTFGNTSGGSLNLFDEYLKRLEEKVVLVGTGGKLTMLSEATGIGGGATGAHADAFDDLAIAMALEISQLLQRKLSEPWLNALFPGQEIKAYFEIAAVDQDDLDGEAERVVKLNQAGHKAKGSWIADKFGVELEDNQQPPAPPTPPAVPALMLNADKGAPAIPPRDPRKEEATKQLLSALGNDAAPAFAGIAEILNKESVSDADFTRVLELIDASGGGEETERAFEQFYASALLGGWGASS